jgi:hypothetical protein
MSLMPWFDAWRFGVQAQQVVMLRMMRFWLSEGSLRTEATRMVTEKMAASAEAQVAAATALMKGQSAKTALKRAATPYRRRVRANHKRLTK